MKVADLIKLFSLGTRYKLVGAKTGLPLYKSWENKNLDKFKDLDVDDNPIEPSLQIERGTMIGEPECVRTIILIYVSGL